MSNKNSFQVLLLLPPPSSSNANRFVIEPKGFTTEPQIELSDFFFFFFPDGSQLVHPLAGLNCLRYRGVFLIFLKVFFTAASRSGSGPSSANGNSLHGTFSGTIAGCFFGYFDGKCRWWCHRFSLWCSSGCGDRFSLGCDLAQNSFKQLLFHSSDQISFFIFS